MLKVSQLHGFNIVSTVSVVTSFYSQVLTNTADSTSYSFSSTSIGTEPAAGQKRYIVLVVGQLGGSNANLNSLTIGGNAVTIIDNGTTSANVKIGMLEVPTGTTATVAATFSATRYACAIAVYFVYTTGSSLDVVGQGSGTSTANVNTEAGGVVIAGSLDSTYTTSVTWTGVSEQYDAALGTAFRFSTAVIATVIAETPRTITAATHDTCRSVCLR